MKKNFRLNLVIFVLILFVASIGISASGVGLYNYGVGTPLAPNINALSPTPPLTADIRSGKDGECHVDYKICDLVPFKSVDVRMLENKKVYLGGKPLGLSMRVGGLIITKKLDVVTDKGLSSPTKDVDIQSGDILIAINGVKTNTPQDVARILRGECKEVTLTIKRNNDILNVNITPVLDALSHTPKLGLWLREDIEGIGTLTYVDKETRRYGALGHVIKDFESGIVYGAPSGNIYDASIYGVVRGERGKAGELSGGFNRSGEDIGTLDTNCDFGVFGNYSGDTCELEEVTLGCKYSVRPGKAYIYTTIDGMTPKKYEIEIIKSSHQTSPKTRGLLLRVTDKELLEKVGGIVQGMSGSPIVQGGKLVGAVTHVFIGDPTKGYGTYIDWMLPN